MQRAHQGPCPHQGATTALASLLHRTTPQACVAEFSRAWGSHTHVHGRYAQRWIWAVSRAPEAWYSALRLPIN